MTILNFEKMPYEVYEKALLKELKPSWKKNLLEAYRMVKSDNKDYVIRVIDGEAVVYLDMDDYDIEVSGLCQRKRSFNIFVWSKNPLTTVHIVRSIKGLDQLKMELIRLEEQFKEGDIKEWGNNW